MSETIDHMRGRVQGLKASIHIVYEFADHEMCPDAASPAVQLVRHRLLDALFAEQRSVLKDIRLAKAKVGRKS